MKQVILALPLTLVLAAAAIAQSDTTTTGGTAEAVAGAATGATSDATASAEFGTNWPLSVGTTFFTDADSAMLRTADELSKGWKSLSPEDQAMIRADCQAFLAAHAADADASAATSTDTTAGRGTASTDTTATGTASTDAATSAPVGYDLAEMRAICEAVGTF